MTTNQQLIATDEVEPLPDLLREIARERRLDADGIAADTLDEAADALKAAAKA